MSFGYLSERESPAGITTHLVDSITSRTATYDASASKKGLGLFQIKRVEAFGEPTVDRTEQIVSLLMSALTTPQPGYAQSRPKVPGLCLLPSRDRKRSTALGCGSRARLMLQPCRG